jgi:mRNA interferase YafQ
MIDGNETKYEVKQTSRFKRDYKAAKKRGYDIPELRKIVFMLANDEPLPPMNRDHALTGDWFGYRECHIKNDWLLVYKKEEDVLVLTLTRTGTHSDLNF